MKRIVRGNNGIMCFYDSTEIGGKAKAREILERYHGTFAMRPANNAYYVQVITTGKRK